MPAGIYPHSVRHGHSRRGKFTRTYICWAQMKARCLSPGATRYERYGGRGIKVCDRWLDFEGFLADMGECPEGMTIERRDNNGNYDIDNCYWATYRAQNNNNSRTTYVEYKGKRQSLSFWAEEYGIHLKTLRSRLFELGWDVQRALETRGRKHERS